MRSIQYLNDVSKSAMKEVLKVQAMQKLQCSTSHKGSEGRSVNELFLFKDWFHSAIQDVQGINLTAVLLIA